MNNLFEVDYLKRSADLFQEAFYFKKYKAMEIPIAVIIALAMLPLQLLSIVFVVPLFFAAFILKFVVSIIRSLHDVVSNEGQKTKHLTQFFVYFFSWPIIFVSYVLAALCYVGLVILYALLACVSYVWTLGGFKFQAYIVDAEDVSVETKGSYSIGIQLGYLFPAMLIVMLTLFISPVALFIFTACYSFLIMSKKPSAEPVDATVIEEVE